MKSEGESGLGYDVFSEYPDFRAGHVCVWRGQKRRRIKKRRIKEGIRETIEESIREDSGGEEKGGERGESGDKVRWRWRWMR